MKLYLLTNSNSLGDRHAENILFDETNGDCVHVDLNMLFDIGSVLAVPEVVPFRLTHNLVDAMGILGYTGTFTVTCEITMNVLLQNKDALTSVFQTLGNVWIFQRDVSRIFYFF
jgi:serine/threonine-protein kinase ATR